VVLFQETDIAMMAAQQYYVENGPNLDPRRLSNLLPNYIPNQFLKSSGGLSKWEKLVADAFQKVDMMLMLAALKELQF
jgi:myosin-7